MPDVFIILELALGEEGIFCILNDEYEIALKNSAPNDTARENYLRDMGLVVKRGMGVERVYAKAKNERLIIAKIHYLMRNSVIVIGFILIRKRELKN